MTTLRVGQDQPYRTIGAALAAAAKGDTVLITAGRYHESVKVEKTIRLTAEPGAVLEGRKVISGWSKSGSVWVA